MASVSKPWQCVSPRCCSPRAPRNPAARRLVSPTTRGAPTRLATTRVMVRTESKDVEVGSFKLPAFSLPEPLTGKAISSIEPGAAATLVIWYAPHCPFVKLLKDALVSLAKEYTPRGVRILAVVSSSLDTHPQDGPAALVEEARALANPFPFLFDETQAVAKSFMAACTPEFYVFDGAGTLQYHGQACDARPKKDPPDVATCADLRAALDDVLGGRPVSRPQKRALGCNIKFTPGNEPAYFATSF